MKKLTITTLNALATDWVDDKPVTPALYRIDHDLVLSVGPDSLHVGRGAHFVAVKNRTADALVLPDFTAVRLAGRLHDLQDAFSARHENRFRWVNGGEGIYVKEYDEDSKTWAIAHVDAFLPDMQTCDLATLRVYSLPVLARYAAGLVRKYSRSPRSNVDAFWHQLVSKYESLGAAVPEDLAQQRLSAIARQRLVAI